MLELRVTKYDPQKRDADGRFGKDEFTSVSDVGRTFNGRVLTVDDYLSAEDGYVDSVLHLWRATGSPSLTVSGVENRHAGIVFRSELEPLRRARVEVFEEGRLDDGSDIEAVVRMCLRELLWCRLSGPDRLYVHFGWDFYLYMGGNVGREQLGPPPAGIFFEDFASPYAV